MSHLALVSDIHVNAAALDTVVADLAHRQVNRIVCLGDVTAGGPYLAAAPSTLRVSVGGLSFFCVHGSPRADVDRLLATTREAELGELLADAPACVLAAGHTHLQLLRPHRQSVPRRLHPANLPAPISRLRRVVAEPACARL